MIELNLVNEAKQLSHIKDMYVTEVKDITTEEGEEKIHIVFQGLNFNKVEMIVEPENLWISKNTI